MLLRHRLPLILCVGVALSITARSETDLKVEDLVQKHLDSFGTSEVRAAAKSRVVEGTVGYRVLVGGSGQIQGNSVMVSEGNKLQLLLKINALKFHGEKFLRNGDKTFVAGTYDDSTRSEFGEFLRGEDLPLRMGALGGVWSTAWPLFNFDSKKGKLQYEGIKKIDGKDFHAVSYHPKKSSDMDITLYFEPETFRHVMTIYKASVHAGIGSTVPGQASPSDLSGGTDSLSARQQQTRYRIEERFSDFKPYDGLTLPSHYDLRFTGEYSNGFTKTVDWDVTATRVLNNVILDPKNFVVP